VAGGVVVGLAAISIVVLPAPMAAAGTDVVTNCSGSPSTPGSLPYEVGIASPGDTITFALSPACSTITLTSRLQIAGLTISGPGSGNLAVSGNGTVGIFDNGPGMSATAAVSGLTMENGSSGSGGAIFNDGTLTVTNCILASNTVTAGGGGIYSDGVLTVTDSTLSNNSSTGAGTSGGAIFNSNGTATIIDSTVTDNSTQGSGGGVINSGTLTVTESTFSGNSTIDFGGALDNESGSAATVTNSTFSDNISTVGGDGGGIWNTSPGTLTLGTTILAGSGASGGDCGPGGPTTDLGYNLDDDGSCGLVATGDLSDTPAGLDPAGLRDNGGPAPTIALDPGSAAIDHVTNASQCPATDERGATTTAPCDIGAYDTDHPPFGPAISAVSPSTGFTTGGTAVTVTGTGFTGATAVDFGGISATFTVSNDTSIAATSPPGSAGVIDVTVTTPTGTSAVSPADRFTYTVDASPTVVPCTPGCTNTVSTPLNATTVSATGSSGTTSQASTSLVVNTGALSCGSTYDYATAVSTFSASGFAPGTTVTVTETVGNEPSTNGVKVCFEKSGGTRGAFLKSCKTETGPAPCVVSLSENGQNTGVVATLLVPSNDPRFWTGGAKVVLKGFSPTTGAPGTKVTIKGKNLTGVVAVVMGGATATVQSPSKSKLVVTVPTGAISGAVTVTAASGSVTSIKTFTVT
jgi:hypothetical protein